MPKRKPQLGATRIERDELDAEQRRQRSASGLLERRRVYLPAWDETYFATAVI
jgi:hypothetical protein